MVQVNCATCRRTFAIDREHRACPHCGQLYSLEEVDRLITNVEKKQKYDNLADNLESAGDAMVGCGPGMMGCGCLIMILTFMLIAFLGLI